MKKLLLFINSTALVGAIAFGMLGLGTTVSAAPDCGTPKECAQAGVTSIGGNQEGRKAGSFSNLMESIINILLFLIGAIAVIMIIIGGIRYVLSGGDSTQTTAAKNTILYAIIGLVVAIMAYAIVNWVIKQL